MRIQEFRLVLTVKDLDTAVAFFRDAVGLEQLAEGQAHRTRVDSADTLHAA